MDTETRKAPSFKGQITLAGIIECVSGLHVGGNREAMTLSGIDLPVARDPATRLPIIPGSTLKGRMRALLEMLRGKVRFERGQVKSEGAPDVIELLFGSPSQSRRGGPTRLIVRDALPVADDSSRESMASFWSAVDGDGLGTEVKAEAALNRVTAAAQPRWIERVVAGSRFAFEITLSVFDEREDEATWIKDVLIALALVEDSYLGGHGSRGYGKVRFLVREQPAIASAKDYESGRRRTQPSGEWKRLSDIDVDAWAQSARQALSS